MKNALTLMIALAVAVSCDYDYKTSSGYTAGHLESYTSGRFCNEVLYGLELVDILTVANDVLTGKVSVNPGGVYGSNTIRHYSDKELNITGIDLTSHGTELFSEGSEWSYGKMTVKCISSTDSLLSVSREGSDNVLEVAISRPGNDEFHHIFKYSGTDPEPFGRYTARWTSEGQCVIPVSELRTVSDHSCIVLHDLSYYDEQFNSLKYLVSGKFRAEIYEEDTMCDWCCLNLFEDGFFYECSLSQ